ncbi:hypothetical protein DL96DRAFT_1679361 [Flagelloscypha sp. PMI_526]|nr:hypothetical protein DL96DRAFT_1679361 [Flagelloscypha sp. PMI_526]
MSPTSDLPSLILAYKASSLGSLSQRTQPPTQEDFRVAAFPNLDSLQGLLASSPRRYAICLPSVTPKAVGFLDESTLLPDSQPFPYRPEVHLIDSRTRENLAKNTAKLNPFVSWLRDAATSFRVSQPRARSVDDDASQGLDSTIRREGLTEVINEIAELDPATFLRSDGTCICPREGCEDILSSISGLHSHIHLHNICEPPHGCTTCCQAFETAGLLKEHQFEHALGFECTKCQVFFETEKSRRLHLCLLSNMGRKLVSLLSCT